MASVYCAARIGSLNTTDYNLSLKGLIFFVHLPILPNFSSGHCDATISQLHVFPNFKNMLSENCISCRVFYNNPLKTDLHFWTLTYANSMLASRGVAKSERVVWQPWVTESKGRQNWQQNNYYKWKKPLCEQQILIYWTK